MTQACPPFLAVLGTRVAKSLETLDMVNITSYRTPASLSHGPNYHSLGLSLSNSLTLLDCFTVPLSLLF